MAYVIEKKRCRRFVVPGANVKFRSGGLLILMREFSGPYPVLNIKKGGVSFTCDKILPIGKKLLVQLHIPRETTLILNCIVQKQRRMMGSEMMRTGVMFMPFGNRHGWNTIDSLDVLRKMDEKYR